jgi:hypothetical protein
MQEFELHLCLGGSAGTAAQNINPTAGTMALTADSASSGFIGLTSITLAPIRITLHSGGSTTFYLSNASTTRLIDYQFTAGLNCIIE